MLELFEETPSIDSSRDGFVLAEERRRTAWTCFLMDSLLSGGKKRVRALSAYDMRVQLPCDTDFFNFGEAVRNEMLDGFIPQYPPSVPIGNLGIIAYSMRAADIWGSVAKWACSTAVDREPPWESGSQFQKLLTSLTQWRLSLPGRLELSIRSLHAHSACNQGM
jgi:hypothetical protein